VRLLPVGVSDEDIEERLELGDRPRLDGLGPEAASSSSARSARPCCRWSGGWGGSSSGGPRGGRARPRKPLQPPLGTQEAGGEDHVVVGEGGARHAVAGRGMPEPDEDDRPGDAAVDGDRQGEACMVVEEGKGRISISSASSSGSRVKSDCHISPVSSAQQRMEDHQGRCFGSTRPARRRWRWIRRDRDSG